MPKQYLIDKMYLNGNRLTVFGCRQFTRNYLLDDFFVEYDDDVDLRRMDSSILQMPFVVNVIPIIWMSGEQYHMRSLDDNFARFPRELRGAFRGMYPNLTLERRSYPR